MTRTYASPVSIAPCHEATWHGRTVPEMLMAAGAYLRQRPDWAIDAIRLTSDGEDYWLTVTFRAEHDQR